MHSAKVELERCFLCSIDSAKAYVSYNEYTLDPGSEMHQYMLNLFAKNFDNISSKKASFSGDSFISQILPDFSGSIFLCQKTAQSMLIFCVLIRFLQKAPEK